MQKMRVFAVAPSDMAVERAKIKDIASRLKPLADSRGIALEIVDWSGVVPDMGRAEKVILDQIKPTSWDVVIGILWHRFGTPPGAKDSNTKLDYQSGTEEEFKTAYKLWKQYGRPRIMMYRCRRNIPPEVLNPDQYKRVQDFFNQFDARTGEHPGLYQSFTTIKSFENLLFDNIQKLLLEYGENLKIAVSERGDAVAFPSIADPSISRETERQPSFESETTNTDDSKPFSDLKSADPKNVFIQKFASLISAFLKTSPFFRISSIVGIVIILFWVGSWVMSKPFSFVPTAAPNISPTVELTITPSKLISSLTPSKTFTPSFTPTITSTITPSLTFTLVPTPISANIVVMENDPRPQNCRVKPNTLGEVVEKIASGTNLFAFGRNENSDWLFVKSESSERYCWINISGVEYQANEIDRLPIGVSYSKGVEMVLVPSGPFTMGKDANDALTECSKYGSSCNLSWFSDANGEYQVYLDAFYIDRYEVTNLDYRECVNNGACALLKQISLSNVKDYYTNPKYNDYPVVYVNWENAKKYCEWRGVQLPTEAQWEKAARGTNEHVFPWGADISCQYANYRKLNNNDFCQGFTTKVGNFKDNVSPYGIYDMAGNVWEWVSSLNKDYPYNANDGREDLDVFGNRVMRGGSWIYYEYNAFVANRNSNLPTSSFEDVGFRCAGSVP